MLDIKGIIETLELNKEDIRGNRELTNEIVIDDIMLTMGYNKKRVRGVKRVYNSDIDWEITIEGENRFIVRTVGYGEDTKLDSNSILENHSGFNMLIITDGRYIGIYSESIDKAEPILEYNINEEEEELCEVLKNLGISEYSYNNIKDTFSSQLLGIEDLNTTIENNLESIIEFILGLLDYKNTNRNRKTIKDRLQSVAGPILNSNNVSIDIDELEIEIKNLKEENRELRENSIAELERQSEKLRKDNKELKRRAEESQTDSNNVEEVLKLKKENEELKQENKELKRKQKEGVSSNELEDNKERINKFISEIEKLNSDKANLKNTIVELESTIYNMKNSKESKQEEESNTAKQLLDTIEDNKKSNRAYVAVIGTKLFQKEDINKFVGTAIEELYEIVGFELLPALFDGDSFVLIQNPEKSDFTINKKQYAIDFLDLTEEDILAKIGNLFRQFKDVNFHYKAIGSEKLHTDRKKSKVTVPISQLKEVVFDESTEVHKIESIGDKSSIKYTLPSSIESDLDLVVSKVIEGLIVMTTNTNEAIKKLRKRELASISKHIEVSTQSNKKSVRIPFTKYIINGIDSLGKCVPILNEVCNILNIDSESILLTIDVTTVNANILDKYSNTIETVEIQPNTISKGDVVRDVVISGNIVDIITFTKKSLKVQSDIVNRVKGIVYEAKQIEIESDDAMIEVAKDIIENRTRTDIDFNVDTVGKVLGEDFLAISDNISDVAVDNKEIQINNTKYYISDMTNVQYMYFIIKLHAVCNQSRNIEFIVEIDYNCYKKYTESRVDLDTSVSLSVRTFLDYIKVDIN